MKILLSLLMAVMFLGGQAVADEENICDGQIGAAYGLCNAFCNAMECNSPEPQASDVACTRVAALFEQITGSPPPVPIPCPAWTQDQIIIYYEPTYNSCNDNATHTYDDGSIKYYDTGSDTNDSIYFSVKSLINGDYSASLRVLSGDVLQFDTNQLISAEQHAACTRDITNNAFKCE